MEARDTAKKFCLQTRSKLAVRRQKIQSVFQTGSEIEFLDMETSLAVCAEVIGWRKWHHSRYSDFLNVQVEDGFEDVVSIIAALLSASKDQEVFCFTDDWRRRGVFIVRSDSLAKVLPELMFVANDWLKIYTPDLKRAILIDGDRTGTWDHLNALNVHVLGQDWVSHFQVTGLTLEKPQ